METRVGVLGFGEFVASQEFVVAEVEDDELGRALSCFSDDAGIENPQLVAAVNCDPNDRRQAVAIAAMR